MQFENVTRRVAGSIDVTISSSLIERLNDIAEAPRPTEQLIDDHWTAIASIVHRKVARVEIEEDGSVEIGIADLDIDHVDPVEVARIEAQAELHAVESVGSADRVGRWFGDARRRHSLVNAGRPARTALVAAKWPPMTGHST